VRQRSEKYVVEGSKYAHLIGLNLSFRLRWVLGPFAHGRLQNLKTNQDTFGHDITPLGKFSGYPRSRYSSFTVCFHWSTLEHVNQCTIVEV